MKGGKGGVSEPFFRKIPVISYFIPFQLHMFEYSVYLSFQGAVCIGRISCADHLLKKSEEVVAAILTRRGNSPIPLLKKWPDKSF